MKVYLDIECYVNYFLIMLLTETGKVKAFEQAYDEIMEEDQRQKILALLTDKRLEYNTFNGNGYDMPVTTMMLTGESCPALKMASDDIIGNKLTQWAFSNKYNIKTLYDDMNHIDLMNVAPGKASLKMYAARLHAQYLEDLPYPPEAELDDDQMDHIMTYCRKDLANTRLLREALSEEIALRETIEAEYGIQVRSCSDAQIAERVLAKEFHNRTGVWPPKTKLAYDHFYYEPPKYIRFKTQYLNEALDTICNARMDINPATGHVIMPKEIEKLVLKIGKGSYKVGIGGLHSQEKEQTFYSDADNILIDRDVASYYPQMIINMNMNPGSFGEHFIPAYEKILKDRLKAKAAGDKVKSDSLKIVLNSTFGKTSQKYSVLYSPKLMIMTTLSGQLSILMLIEILELYGIPVVSANTDGIVINCPRDKKADVDLIISKWEKHTNLVTEETVYRSLHSRDVNNYFAVKEDLKAKRKGVYGDPGLSKNPANTVCSRAVMLYLTQGVPPEHTITESRDIREFVTCRAVTGGAHKDGQPIGKTVRWYYAKGVTGEIQYIKTGNAVPRSEGAKPCMDLPDEFPDDLDFDWYVKEADAILMDIGVKERPFVPKIPRKNSKAWKELVEKGEIVEGKKGKWEWVQSDE